MKEDIEKILINVERPARYLGDEYNSIHKEWQYTSLKMVFCFPDIYEVGMSHLGLRILYGLVNEKEDFLLERCFAPWIDMENELRKRNLPLFSLESFNPLRNFDVIGFTLQYEMSYTNVLNMLDLAQIPLASKDRGEEYPLIIAGGPCVFNPEPMADFIDFFILGDAEELLIEILEEIKNNYLNGVLTKKQLFERLAEFDGVYVPSLYDFEKEQYFQGIKPTRRILKNFNEAYFPLKPIVPYVETVHDRIMLEVARGCTRGCRFCQAGMIYRPVREKTPATLERQAVCSLSNTGYEEISLTSLSSVDYTCIEEITKRLLSIVEKKKIGLSLPSLRVDIFSVNLVKEIQKVRKTGLTFAPEAGTQRLRDVINKGVTDEDIKRSVTGAFESGWEAIKLYFMIGLPTENNEDLQGIANLVYEILEIGKEIKKKQNLKRPVRVTVSVASFVPKPHTPFQWVAQDTIEVLKEKQMYLRKILKDKRITYNYHQPQLSFLEAVFSRGDRKLGKVLQSAWKKGCKFDSWDEHFNYNAWLEAFFENEINAEEYAYKKRDMDESFPWDIIDIGVTKNFLKKEYQRSIELLKTSDCRYADCPGCGVCPRLDVDLELIKGGSRETSC